MVYENCGQFKKKMEKIVHTQRKAKEEKAFCLSPSLSCYQIDKYGDDYYKALIDKLN